MVSCLVWGYEKSGIPPGVPKENKYHINIRIIQGGIIYQKKLIIKVWERYIGITRDYAGMKGSSNVSSLLGLRDKDRE